MLSRKSSAILCESAACKLYSGYCPVVRTLHADTSMDGRRTATMTKSCVSHGRHLTWLRMSLADREDDPQLADGADRLPLDPL